ncbi:hypothetical protein LXL04_011740 [Taraxacum kok-saghyz]
MGELEARKLKFMNTGTEALLMGILVEDVDFEICGFVSEIELVENLEDKNSIEEKFMSTEPSECSLHICKN